MEIDTILPKPLEEGGIGKEPPRILNSRPMSFPLNRSTSEYPSSSSSLPFQSFPNASTSRLPDMHPPDYDEPLGDFQLPPSRFKIAPREEEGRELLPAYSCSLKAESVFHKKSELTSPFERAEDRAWSRVFVVLEGTMLKIHKVKTASIFSKPKPEVDNDPDRPLWMSAGSLIGSYTLQHAEVGIAGDYKKFSRVPLARLWKMMHIADFAHLQAHRRPYVIRIRAETEQFLLCCNSMNTFFSWLEYLNAAIMLALPLEERTLPRYQTLPRRRRNRPREVVRQQELIIQELFPNLAQRAPRRSEAASKAIRPSCERSTSSPILGDRNSVSADARFEPRRAPSLTVRPVAPRANFSDQAAIDPEAGGDDDDEEEEIEDEADGSRHGDTPSRQPSTNGNSSSSSASSSSGDDEPAEYVKWNPAHEHNPDAERRRVRRCQRVLNADEPRLSEIFVKDGKKWMACNRRMKLVPYAIRLPDYHEAELAVAVDERADLSRWRRMGLPEQGF